MKDITEPVTMAISLDSRGRTVDSCSKTRYTSVEVYNYSAFLWLNEAWMVLCYANTI